MKNWITSLRGSVLISSIAFIAFIGYVFLEMRYFLGEWIPDEAAAMMLTIITLLIISGWLRALFVAANGRRAGLVALLVFSLFSALIAVYDMQYVLFSPMPWPEQVMVYTILVTGIINAVVLSVRLKRN